MTTRPATALLALLAATACGGDEPLERPTPLYGEEPVDYPLEMWDQDVEGQTLLRVRVTDVGGVDSIEVAESSGYAELDSAAVAGVRKLRFRPARRGEKRIEVWAEIPVHFSKKPRPGN